MLLFFGFAATIGSSMRLLYLGDVFGRGGRQAVSELLPGIRRDRRIDFAVVNAENATDGRGLSLAHAEQLFDAGADCLTLGDHAFDQREMIAGVEREPRILRPLNYGRSIPGRGARVFDAPNGRRVLVAQALGRVFMRPDFDDPFAALDSLLRAHPLRTGADAVIVDFHAEATSEKNALGHYLDGRASLVVGSHTHVPTADARILAGGTAYQSDAGMCGVYESVIGFDRIVPVERFRTGLAPKRMTPARGAGTVSGVFVETSDSTGLAVKIEHVVAGATFVRRAAE